MSVFTLEIEMLTFFATYDACIAQDIKKMENQIPLPVLKEVFQYVIENTVGNETLSFNQLLPIICWRFSPFAYAIPCLDIAENERNKLINSMAKEPHFLGCLHRALSQVLQMQSGDGGQRKPTGIPRHKFNDILNKLVIWIRFFLHPLGILLQKLNNILKTLVKWIGGLLPAVPSTAVHLSKGMSAQQLSSAGIKFRCFTKLPDYIRGLLPAVPSTAVHFSNGMSAQQLSSAGIKFKCFTKLPDYIRLDKESGTLYLPQIRVNDTSTEVYLRNMMALEFNDDPRPKYVTLYVDLMGDLIQSPDDVRILLDRQVISGGALTLTDERMAQMWYDVRQPFFSGSWIQIHEELYTAFEEWFKGSYWRNNIKRSLCEFHNFVLSWKFAGPFAALLGLIMTAIQTYCSLYHCTR